MPGQRVLGGSREAGAALPRIQLKWILSLDLESRQEVRDPPRAPSEKRFFFGSHHESLTER